jgi:hypothetical protein
LQISTSMANEFLAGAAIFLVLSVIFSVSRRRIKRHRRPKPAYPSAPHTTKMWADQPVSAPATTGHAFAEQPLERAAEVSYSVADATGPFS